MKRHLLLLAAITLPTLSAASGPATSFADAAKLHRAGNTAAAMAFWAPLAQKGDANAAYNLAVIHEHGDGVARNLTEAQKWYRIAAEKGDRASQSRLGTMYLNGEGTAKNEKEGWRWINEHRVAHMHHDHHPQMQAWRKQAADLVAARDMRECQSVETPSAMTNSAAPLSSQPRSFGPSLPNSTEANSIEGRVPAPKASISRPPSRRRARWWP
jgi:TPR repeat protein